MGTPHIGANKGDFAKVVLMPGDPLRAKWIAENYLVEPKLVTNVRGILGYTGKTKNGKLVSVMASGMGMPSIGIYSHELFTSFDVEVIIRVGTCGTYQEKIKLFDVIVASGASTDSNWMGQFDLHGGTYSAIADFGLVESAVQIARDKKQSFAVGNVLSSDVFYDEDKESWKRWARLGLLGVEMESYALYVNAASLNKKALCLLTVTDSFLGGAKATAEERQLGLGKMIDVAIGVAEKYA